MASWRRADDKLAKKSMCRLLHQLHYNIGSFGASYHCPQKQVWHFRVITWVEVLIIVQHYIMLILEFYVRLQNRHLSLNLRIYWGTHNFILSTIWWFLTRVSAWPQHSYKHCKSGLFLFSFSINYSAKQNGFISKQLHFIIMSKLWFHENTKSLHLSFLVLVTSAITSYAGGQLNRFIIITEYMNERMNWNEKGQYCFNRPL